MKDIYRNMNRQNILNFYGSKFDLRLDSSELYDFEISKDVEYNKEVLDLTTPITYSTLIIDSDCLTNPLQSEQPWVVLVNTPYITDSCDFTIKRRTEKGWTLDFIFDRNNIPWSGGSTFYYLGISGETNERYFADNNLSFSFTEDGKIKWESYRYSGVCDSGYTETFYISSGQTPTLCQNGVSSLFNLTITFDRYKHYSDCDIENEGGWNDLIRGPHVISYTNTVTGSTTTQIVTGYTITNSLDVLTGTTPTYEFIEELNKKWSNERQKRLGVLKIYLNGNTIYKLDNWEEIIPSLRQSDNPIVQIWGGGTNGFNSLHTGDTQFNLVQVKYYEEPLSFINVRHNYITSVKQRYPIIECTDKCEDNSIGYFLNGLLTESEEYIITENNNDIILY